MLIDHIFIFSKSKGKEADELRDFGLTESPGRRHPGQGTQNRKFHFQDFFLEILWVVDQHELLSGSTFQSKLWQRAQYQQNGFSPFGLCFRAAPPINLLFKTAIAYQPAYFPEGKTIAVLPNEEHPSLPWTFQLPAFAKDSKQTLPPTHSAGLHRLTKTTFEVTAKAINSAFAKSFAAHQELQFISGHSPLLRLQFDHGVQNKQHRFNSLPLVLEY